METRQRLVFGDWQEKKEKDYYTLSTYYSTQKLKSTPTRELFRPPSDHTTASNDLNLQRQLPTNPKQSHRRYHTSDWFIETYRHEGVNVCRLSIVYANFIGMVRLQIRYGFCDRIRFLWSMQEIIYVWLETVWVWLNPKLDMFDLIWDHLDVKSSWCEVVVISKRQSKWQRWEWTLTNMTRMRLLQASITIMLILAVMAMRCTSDSVSKDHLNVWFLWSEVSRLGKKLNM